MEPLKTVSDLDLAAELTARRLLETVIGKQIAASIGDPEPLKVLLRLAFKRGQRSES